MTMLFQNKQSFTFPFTNHVFCFFFLVLLLWVGIQHNVEHMWREQISLPCCLMRMWQPLSILPALEVYQRHRSPGLWNYLFCLFDYLFTDFSVSSNLIKIGISECMFTLLSGDHFFWPWWPYLKHSFWHFKVISESQPTFHHLLPGWLQ